MHHAQSLDNFGENHNEESKKNKKKKQKEIN